MRFTDTDLSALLDGELNPSEARKLRAELALDSSLTDRLEQLAFTDAIIKNTYQSIDAEALPRAVVNLLADNSITQSNTVSLNRSVWTTSRLTQIAAVVVLSLAVIFGTPVFKQNANNLYTEAVTIGPLNPQSALDPILKTGASAVTHRLNNTQSDAESVVAITPVLSFKNLEGDWCREYTVTTESRAARALACTSNRQWQIVLTSLDHSISEPNNYATASTTSAAEFDEFIDDKINGDPLSADQERKLIERNWQTTLP